MPADVLVVEDEAHARYSLVQILTRAGYSVMEASDGETALELLQRERFALIVADIRMGLVDGLDVLRASQQLAEPPAVILLTGYGALETAVAALRGKAADYLLKPVDPEQLLASVAAALERRSEMLYNREAAQLLVDGFAALQRRASGNAHVPNSAAAHMESRRDALVLGALVIGEHRLSVQYHGRVVVLTPTEFAILRCLAEAEDHMLTYEALAACSYGYTAGISEAQVLLKAHVRNLRRKLAPGIIQTVRGVGYRLVAT